MKTFFEGVLKIGVAIVGSCAVLALIGGVTFWGVDVYKKNDAKPYQAVKRWESDLSDPLYLKMAGKTKLVDGRMYAEFTFDGYPSYLTNDTNRNDGRVGFSLHFLDGDGFEISAKNLPLTEAFKVNADGKIVGLRYSYDEYMPVETYSRFQSVHVGWTLNTELPASAASTLTKPSVDVVQDRRDPCEPNISKAERIKRLARNGVVRQAGEERYEAGSHAVQYFQNELLSCN